MSRIDLNDEWWKYAGPGGFNDPDMVTASLSLVAFRVSTIFFAVRDRWVWVW